jgi:hypothetical protein
MSHAATTPLLRKQSSKEGMGEPFPGAGGATEDLA